MATTFAERDEFNRKPIAEKLIRLLKSDIPVSPLMIDGPWGSGKTEFCLKLINLCEEQQLPAKTLYLNAYKFDHSDDPLLMLMSGIASLIEDKSTKEVFIQKAIPVAKVLGRFGAKAVISWLFKASADDIGTELADATSSNSGDVVDAGIKKIIGSFEEVDESITTLKDILTQIANKKQIIIFIDELDRCRPTFALSLIEKIKHIFDIKGIDFVFTTNLDQLCAIVKKQYGLQIDAEEYLSKFFGFKMKLPEDSTENTVSYYQNSYDLLERIWLKDEKLRYFIDHGSSVTLFIQELFRLHNRSLRDTEKFTQNIQILNALGGKIRVNRSTGWGFVASYLLGVYVYTFNSDFTNKLIRGTYTHEDLSSFFSMNAQELQKFDGKDLTKTMFALLLLDMKSETLEKYLPHQNSITQLNDIVANIYNYSVISRWHRLVLIQDAIRTMQLL